MAIKLSNDVMVPDIPEDVKAQYPYLIIVKWYETNVDDVTYELYGSTSNIVYVPSSIYTSSINVAITSTQISSYYVFRTGSGLTTWQISNIESPTKNLGQVGKIGLHGDNTVYKLIVWSNHDIYQATTYSENSDNIQFTVGTKIYAHKFKNFSGIWLPRIPDNALQEYPYYYLMRSNDTTYNYGLALSKTPFIFVPSSVATDGNGSKIVSVSAGEMFYMYAELFGGVFGTGTWMTLTSSSESYFSYNIGTDYVVIDSNHDIYIATKYNGNDSVTIGQNIYFVNPNKIITSDRHYKAIASKVREILGESTQYKPRELPDAIRSTSSLLNPYEISRGVIFRKESIPTAITTDTLYPGAYNDVETECFFIPENVIKIAPYTFSFSDAKEVRFHDKVTTIFDYAFNAAGITTLNLPSSITSIGKIAFATCSDLVNVIINSATIPSLYGTFYQCRVLERIDIKGKVTTIDYNAFAECNSLNTLIIRGSSRASLANVNAFSGTPITSGDGYIYVPSALLSSYKSATRWSTYASQIRAIEDYPDVCDPVI